MFGDNPIRKPEKGDGNSLDIQEIFATFQGEGIYTGWPAVFVRLGGCNLACSFCDTEFESFSSMAIPELLQKVEKLSSNDNGERVRNLVVITGGEPFRQPLAPLCQLLLDAGFMVQIETNGTLYREVPAEVDIVCSPKNTGAGYKSLREDILERINALKFIVSDSMEEYRDIGQVGQEKYNIPVYVQPMDQYDAEKNKQNMKRVVELSRKYGYRVSVQTHKVAGVS